MPIPPRLQRSALRRHWALRPDVVFLNHGSFGACPKIVLDRQEQLRRELESEPVQFLWRRWEERLEPARKALAAFLGARPQDLVFITNATAGVNAVARSLPLRPGDEILTTNFDYNACRNVLVQAANQAGARLVVAQAPFPLMAPADVTKVILRKVTPRTRLVLLDHVSSDTSVILPVVELIRDLEARGIDVLVDGAHAPGMLPLNLKKLGAAYYTGNLHKWVCAPKGAAFLWVREDRQQFIQPAVISHGNNRPRPGFTPFQDRFDWAGTADPTPWFCVPDALKFMAGLFPGGWPELRKNNHQLVVQARKLLCERFVLEPPCPDNMLGFLATVPLPARLQTRPWGNGRIDALQLRLYDEFGIEVPFIQRTEDGSRWFRISAAAYNSLAEYDYLADCLDRL